VLGWRRIASFVERWAVWDVSPVGSPHTPRLRGSFVSETLERRKGEGHGGAFTAFCGLFRRVSEQGKDWCRQLRDPVGRQAMGVELRLVPRVIRHGAAWLRWGAWGRRVNLNTWLDWHVQRRPLAPAVVGEDGTLSWLELRGVVEAWCAACRREHIQAGQCVVLCLPNGGELLAAILGCSRIGVVPVVLDAEASTTLIASVVEKTCATRVIVRNESSLDHRQSAVLSGRVRSVGALLGEQSHRDGASAITPIAATRGEELFVVLATSGSTGNAKLCPVSHGKAVLSGHGFGGIALGLHPSDTLYCPLPLSHATGLLVAWASSVVCGATLVTPVRFSRTRFWQELERHRVTHVVCVGELWRYAVASLPSSSSVPHTLRVAMGNGFDERTVEVLTTRASASVLLHQCTRNSRREFGFGRSPKRLASGATGREAAGPDGPSLKWNRATGSLGVVEFYGATEMPSVMFEFSGRKGAMGRVPWRQLSRWIVVAHDPETGELVRDEHGRPLVCGPHETGELLLRVPARPRGWLGAFEGYRSDAGEHHALVRGLFDEQDCYYRTSDLVWFDSNDYFYFVDRCGDLLRRSGENISSAYLESVILSTAGIVEVAVVEMNTDHHGARYLVANIVCCDTFRLLDLTQTLLGLRRAIRPEFVRAVKEIPRTRTFKVRRDLLRAASLDLGNAQERVYTWSNSALVAVDFGELERDRTGA
jgi:fatty-acyl-CoA synthase